MNNTQSSTYPEYIYPTDICTIFSDPKCEKFTTAEKEQIQRAYTLALDIHNGQTRYDDSPYMVHILRSVRRYIAEGVPGSTCADARYVLAMILHDTIENYVPRTDNIDQPNAVEQIFLAFGNATVVDILRMSEPKRHVREQVQSLYKEYPVIYSLAQGIGLDTIYTEISENRPNILLETLDNSARGIPKIMIPIIHNLWNDIYKGMYESEVNVEKQISIYADFYFQVMQTTIDVHIYRLRSTVHRDNMDDIQGTIQQGKWEDLSETLHTTNELYIAMGVYLSEISIIEHLKDSGYTLEARIRIGKILYNPEPKRRLGMRG